MIYFLFVLRKENFSAKHCWNIQQMFLITVPQVLFDLGIKKKRKKNHPKYYFVITDRAEVRSLFTFHFSLFHFSKLLKGALEDKNIIEIPYYKARIKSRGISVPKRSFLFYSKIRHFTVVPKRLFVFLFVSVYSEIQNSIVYSNGNSFFIPKYEIFYIVSFAL